MKIINTNQFAAVSGGCQKAVDKYELSAGFYQTVGTITGFAVGYMATAQGSPARALASVAGAYIGSELGYVFGAASYWIDRAVYKTTDGFLKPNL